MTDKELRKLSRMELIDIIYEAQKRYEDCARENQKLKTELEERNLKIASAGSIAEAALSVNRIFESAQAAADQYLFSLQSASEDAQSKIMAAEEEHRQILAQAEQEASGILADAQKKAQEITAQAERQSEKTWQAFQQKVTELINVHEELRLLAKGDGLFNG